MQSEKQPKHILVTGATGYVGGLIIPRLIGAGHQVRVMVRDAQRVQDWPWSSHVSIFEGDVLIPETLPAVLAGIQVAYYLIHSMSDSHDFHDQDMKAARNFAHAAKEAGVDQIIYLGGLGDPEDQLSPHLRSRQQTGEALQEAGVSVTELRAAVIVGSGSVSFEMIRYLTERVPLMICPQWVYTKIQPIAISNVLDYMVAALDQPLAKGKVIEIGGKDVMTYGDMMIGYARVRGLRRFLVPVPVLTPRLSSYWVHWVTPVSAEIARPLIKGLRNEVIVRDIAAKELFPEVDLLGYEQAVTKALDRLDARQVEKHSIRALSERGDIQEMTLVDASGMFIERRQKKLVASPETVFKVFSCLGGERGWLYANWAWRIRGMMDNLLGGVGFRRGRRDPVEVRVGDPIDFWRVEDVQRGSSLLLRAEMKIPGKAWLLFKAAAQEDEYVLLTQTTYFAPKGLFGLIYWYALYPLHNLTFRGMIEAIAQNSQSSKR